MSDGIGVSEGSGVSVEARVAVTEIVSVVVGAGRVEVDVGRDAVFVGDRVSPGIGVDVELQAKEVNINNTGKISLRFISWEYSCLSIPYLS